MLYNYDHLLIPSSKWHWRDGGMQDSLRGYTLDELMQKQQELEQDLAEKRRREPSLKRSKSSRMEYEVWSSSCQEYIRKLKRLRDEISRRKKGQAVDYSRYIWQIQFQTKSCFETMFPSFSVETTTIDYMDRRCVISRTDKHTQTTVDQIVPIDDDDAFAELLSYSEIAKIREFENMDEEDRQPFDRGYYDGCRLEYTYFTMEDPPITQGTIGRIYENDPIEQIIDWVHRYVSSDAVPASTNEET